MPRGSGQALAMFSRDETYSQAELVLSKATRDLTVVSEAVLKEHGNKLVSRRKVLVVVLFPG